MKIWDRYVLGMLAHGFLTALGIIAGLLILQRFYKIVELAVTRSLDPLQVISLLLWVLPLILFHALPIAMLVGTLLAFGRLATDSELVAAMAAGIGRRRAARYPLLFAVALALVALVNNVWLMPAAYVAFDSVGFGVGIDPMKALKPGSVQRIAGRMLTVDSIEPERHTFRGLLAVVPAEDAGIAEKGSDRGARDRLVLAASSGSWVKLDNELALSLERGSVRALTPGVAGRVLSFASYRLRLPLPMDRSPHPKRKSLLELTENPTHEHLMEIGRRAFGAGAIPLLAFCAIPLALPRGPAHGRGSGARGALIFAFLVYLAYWLAAFGTEALIQKYELSPLVLGAPLLALGGAGAIFWKRRA
jgi:lipopolysaccharide export LptBFGC system permease protein LptF